MSVDPLKLSGSAADVAARITEELTALERDARTLSALLAPGDVVDAVVLPSNGLTDLLRIGTLRVAAELPPTVTVGETIRVMVGDMEGERINVQIVSPGAGDGPVPSASAAPKPTTPSAAPTLAPTPTPTNAAMPNAAATPATRSSVVSVPAALGSLEARLAAANAASGGAPRSGGAVSVPPLVPAVARLAADGTASLQRAAGALRSALAPALTVDAGGPGARSGSLADPAALLRALRLPVTASNLAFARLALEAPQRLPGALSALERALAGVDDPRVSTLSTLAAFVGRIDPRSPVLGAQLEAYVDHVVLGPEARLAQLAQPAAGGGTSAERIASAREALAFDLKTQIAALTADRASAAATSPAPAQASLDRALVGALTALTSIQLGAAAALEKQPDGFSFVVPMQLPEGTARARIQIGRDPERRSGTPLDGDNFQVAFVLETQHLGTIAIHVGTVGRAVTLDVKTEGDPAARAFRAALGSLTERLTALRYRVVRSAVAVAPVPPLGDEPSAVPTEVVRSARRVDVDA